MRQVGHMLQQENKGNNKRLNWAVPYSDLTNTDTDTYIATDTMNSGPNIKRTILLFWSGFTKFSFQKFDLGGHTGLLSIGEKMDFFVFSGAYNFPPLNFSAFLRALL